MFKFLKEKLKEAVGLFSKKVEEEAAEQADEQQDESITREADTSQQNIDYSQKKIDYAQGQMLAQEQELDDGPVQGLEQQESQVKKEDQELQAHVFEDEDESAPTIQGFEQELQQEMLSQTILEDDKEKKSFMDRLFVRPKKRDLQDKQKVLPPMSESEPEPQPTVESVPQIPVSKGIFSKIKETITTAKLSDEKFEKVFGSLEVVLLENNVATEVIEKIKDDLKKELTSDKISRSGVDKVVVESLKNSLREIMLEADEELPQIIHNSASKPYIISFIGVNGSGKTTTIAKVASMLIRNKFSVVMAASDTFRAAAIQQLEEHASRLGVRMIKHDYESDPAAVAFDAIAHAKAKNIDVVLIDTAGRLHTNDNLMNELKKLVRVNKPDLKIFVGEAITGNDCVEQAKLFDEAVGIDAIILAKADVDEKGGASISVSYVTKKPILYLGTGQAYEDLVRFDKERVIASMGL